MKKKGYTAEQIIRKLREAEVLLGQGGTVCEVSRKFGVTEQTYYRSRREYGGGQRTKGCVKSGQKDWIVHSAVQQGCSKKKRNYRSSSVTS